MRPWFGQRIRRLACAGGALAISGASIAHDLQYAVEPASAVVVRLFYSASAGFSYEGYEIFRHGEKIPYQVGRTDANGRLAFLPDRAGEWRIKASSNDGHGVDFTVTTDATGAVSGAERPFFDSHARLLAGVGMLFGLFGVLSLFLRRKAAP